MLRNFVYPIKKLLRILDGDTIDAQIDLGYSTFVEKRIRFMGIDTPEKRTKNLVEKKHGYAATNFLTEQLGYKKCPTCKQGVDGEQKVKIISHGLGKYGRVLGELFIESEETEDTDININEQMIQLGYAYQYEGGRKLSYQQVLEMFPAMQNRANEINRGE